LVIWWRWPTIRTFIAPTALPMKAARNGRCRRPARGSPGEEGVARADRVDRLAGQRRDALHAGLRRVDDAAELAVGDHERVAVDLPLELLAHHRLDRRIALDRGQARLGLVDADEVGARILGDQVEAAIGTVGLGVDGRNFDLRQTMSTRPSSIMPWPKSLTMTAS
jgi:hypothetical protein